MLIRLLSIIIVSSFAIDVYGQSYTISGTCGNNPASPTVFTPSVNLPAGTFTLTWNFGDGTAPDVRTNALPVNHTYTLPGPYTTSLFLNLPGGDQTITKTVTITPCMAKFTLPQAPYCQYLPLQFTDVSTNFYPISSWKWDFGDGTQSTTTTQFQMVSHPYSNTGPYTVTLTLTLDLSKYGVMTPVLDSYSQNIDITSSPVVGFNYNNACPGSPVSFTNATQWGGSIASSPPYSWNFGDPFSNPSSSNLSQLSDPTHTYSRPGSYIVTLDAMSNSGCGSTYTSTVTIFDLPKAGFNSSKADACTNDTIKFADQSTPVGGLSWLWTISSGSTNFTSTLQNVPYTFTSPGKYNVILKVTDMNGCSGTVSKTITAYQAPTGLISAAPNQGQTQGYVMFSYLRTNNTTGPQLWDFGNGETSLDPTHLVHYAVDSNYKVSLILFNTSDRCTDTVRMDFLFYYKGLYIPNALAPGYPDDTVKIFKPAGVNLKEYDIEIYNRWGNLVWKSNKLDSHGRPTEAWDGKLNGDECQEGIYVWKVKAIFKDNTIWTNRDLGEHKNLPNSTFGNLLLIR